MRLYHRVVCFLLFSVSLTCCGGQQDPFRAVQEFFSAISDFDYDRMGATVTEDFHLLEVGEVWELDQLVDVIKTVENRFERRNYFSVIKAVANHNMVWISYWNRAVKKYPDRVQEVSWLESAVMVKVENEWKLQMLHSTRVDPGTIPGDVVFEEYVD